jgi:hypothetical protein
VVNTFHHEELGVPKLQSRDNEEYLSPSPPYPGAVQAAWGGVGVEGVYLPTNTCCGSGSVANNLPACRRGYATGNSLPITTA